MTEPLRTLAITAVRGSAQAWLRAGVELLGVAPVDAVALGDTAWLTVPAGPSVESVVSRSQGCLAVSNAARPAAARPMTPAFSTRAVLHTADEGFEVVAPSRADLLAAAAEALAGIMVGPASVRPDASLVCSVTAEQAGGPDDERMFAWLNEVLFHMDAHRFAIRRVTVVRDDADGVDGVLFGEPLDEARHDVHGAIKAVTYHALEVGPLLDGTWRAQVVVDV